MDKPDESAIRISFAPLQGFSDYVYRSLFSEIFPGVDEFYIPYITLQSDGTLRKSHLREIAPENNKEPKVIPQILAGNAEEFLFLAQLLEKKGYSEINLNLGCPYPMVAKRGKGSGLLPTPYKIRAMLERSIPLLDSSLSIKMRSGYFEENEFIKVLEVLNTFPLKKIIFHPRTGKQLYKGEANVSLFNEALKRSKHPLSYNGDIFTKPDFEQLKARYPNLNDIMIGRGILSNPFLPAEIKGILIQEDKTDLLYQFHNRIFEKHHSLQEGDSHILNKMLSFWEYLSHSFQNPHKVYKLIKKAKNRKKYEAAVHEIFQEYPILL